MFIYTLKGHSNQLVAVALFNIYRSLQFIIRIIGRTTGLKDSIDLSDFVTHPREFTLYFLDMGVTAGLAGNFKLHVHEAVSILELVVVKTYDICIESCEDL